MGQHGSRAHRKPQETPTSNGTIEATILEQWGVCVQAVSHLKWNTELDKAKDLARVLIENGGTAP